MKHELLKKHHFSPQRFSSQIATVFRTIPNLNKKIIHTAWTIQQLHIIRDNCAHFSKVIHLMHRKDSLRKLWSAGPKSWFPRPVELGPAIGRSLHLLSARLAEAVASLMWRIRSAVSTWDSLKSLQFEQIVKERTLRNREVAALSLKENHSQIMTKSLHNVPTSVMKPGVAVSGIGRQMWVFFVWRQNSLCLQ